MFYFQLYIVKYMSNKHHKQIERRLASRKKFNSQETGTNKFKLNTIKDNCYHKTIWCNNCDSLQL